MRVLFVTYGLPVPPHSGARLHDFHLIRRVARRHEVSVLSLLESADELEHLDEMRAHCHAADAAVGAPNMWGALLRGLPALHRRPLATAPYWDAKLARILARWTREHAYDVVQIEHSFLAPFRTALPRDFSGATVLSFHNVGAAQYGSMVAEGRGLERWVARLKAVAMTGWEVRWARRFDRVLTVSHDDERALRNAGLGVPISVIPNGCDAAACTPCATQPTAPELLFVGTMGYLPNRAAVRWFCDAVLPGIRAKHATAVLHVVGPGGRRHLADLHRPGLVEIHDRVADLRPFYERARVVVVPLRSGGGTRLKVLEAMAHGRPVVSTGIGCEGLELAPDEVAIARDAGEFAARTVELLTDTGRWRAQASAARRAAETRFDWDPIAEQLLATYASIAKAEVA